MDFSSVLSSFVARAPWDSKGALPEKKGWPKEPPLLFVMSDETSLIQALRLSGFSRFAFRVAVGFLNLACHLLGIAFYFRFGITRHPAGDFLRFACRLFQTAFYLILVHNAPPS